MTALAQRMNALDAANRQRTAAANLRLKLKGMSKSDGRLLVADLIEQHDPIATRMRLGHLLTGVHGIAWKKAHSMCASPRLRVSVDRHSYDLTDRQREVLIEMLRKRP